MRASSAGRVGLWVIGAVGFSSLTTGCFEQGFAIRQVASVASVSSGSATLPNTPQTLTSATPLPSVVPTARSPVAVDDGPFEVAQDQSLTLDPAVLIANDTDPAGSALSFHGFDNPTSGSIASNQGKLVFTPSAQFTGAVTFHYQVQNASNLSANGLVTINVRKVATEAMYGQTPTTLYSYDSATQVSTSIAQFKLATGGGVNVTDIAITPSGLMYGVDGSRLYSIDASTGIMTPIAANFSAFGNINGMTSLSDGKLIISGNGVASYDIAAHTMTTLVNPGSYQSSGDIIALPDGYLYLSAYGSSSDQLIRIDPHNGALQKIGDFGKTGVYGLGYANHTFYGFTGGGEVFEIDSVTASASHSVSTGNVWYGATTNPVKW